MDVRNDTVKEALDTMLWLNDSVLELEEKAGALMEYLNRQQVDGEPVLELFRVLSQIRFHLEEAEEYQRLVKHHRKAKRRRHHLLARTTFAEKTAARRQQLKDFVAALAVRVAPRREPGADAREGVS